MLHKLNLDANSMAISYWQVWEQVYTNIFSFGERILPDYGTHDVMLFNSLARPMKLRCAFNKDFVVNQWRVILNNCSYKWFCFSNSYRCICQKP